MDKNKTIKSYKGMDKDMKCRGFQYEVGKTYETDTAELCKCGFHACEAPLDVLRYYLPTDGSRYFAVEQDGVCMERSSDDTKIASKKITIKAEIGILGLAKAQFEYVKAHTTNEYTDPNMATAGYRGAATAGDSGAATAGYRGAATAGDRGAATAGYRGAATAGNHGAATAGDYGAATSRGKVSVGADGVGTVRGNNVRIRGGLGALLTIAEEQNDSYTVKWWKSFKIDGKRYKPNVWYTLKDGKIVEADS